MTNLELQKILQHYPNDIPVFVDLGNEDMSAACHVKYERMHRIKDSWLEIIPTRYKDES